GDWLKAPSACRTLLDRKLSLATAESGMAASSPPTTRMKTNRRRPLTVRTPLFLRQRRGRFASSGRRPLALADWHNVTPISRSRQVAKSYGCHAAVTWPTLPGPFPAPPRRGRATGGSSSRLSLDGGGDQAPPFRPVPVVVPDVGVTEQVGEDEPGM